MAIIYQWMLEEDFNGNVQVRKHEVKAKETAMQYRVTTNAFIDFRRTLPKDKIDSISRSLTGKPIYSSLSPSDNIALANLKRWYRDYANQRVAQFKAKIAEHQSKLLQVENLSNKEENNVDD